MKYETIQKRREKADKLADLMLAKAKDSSVKHCVSEQHGANWAFVAGYLQSTIARLAASSPSAMKALEEML